MRDPKRIEKVLNEIRGMWHQYPDLRLGQLLYNSTPTGKDIFYVEDEDLVLNLKRYCKEIKLP